MWPAYEGKIGRILKRNKRGRKSWSEDLKGPTPWAWISKHGWPRWGPHPIAKFKSPEIFLLVFEEIPNSNLNQ